MEVEEIQTQPFKLSRTGNGRSESNKIGQTAEQYQDEDEEDGEGGGGGGGVGVGSNVGNEGGRLRGWPSSRIIRVSRASGGKDRHSKVWTARGPRDRRVRLSVSTAIQFYDLQDRLGYDQPSKAVEWLIKAAEDAIAELPSLNNAFPETPKQPSDEKRRSPSETRFDHPEVELEADPNYQQQQPISLSKSASSTSDTSKGSVYSLSRSEIRVKARERARERTAKEKVKEKEESHVAYQQNLNTTSRTSSFTELLTGGGGGTPSNNGNSNNTSAQQNTGGGHSFIHRPIGQLSSSPMDYFGVGLFGQSASRAQPSSGYSSQTLFGNPQQHSMTVSPQFNVTGDHHHELQQFSFLPDNLMPVSPAAGSDYNLNFTISSGLAGFNRGTLQSNSPSPLPHLQRFPSPVDGPNVPFFMGTAASAAVAVDNNQFPAGFDGRLQLYYGDGCRHPDLKGKGKN